MTNMLISVARVNKIFGIVDKNIQRDDLAFITMKKDDVLSTLVHLRDIEKYTHLVMITAIDYIEIGKFQITYLLHNYFSHTDIGVRTLISRDHATMDSMHHLWKQVATYQRELHEMFGINFPNSPRVEENFVLEGWQSTPPMRRDFDTLKYSKDNYNFRKGRSTNDPKTFMKEKLYKD